MTIPEDEIIGSRIGRIRVEELIDAGGMGTVYRGYDEILARPVALKIAGRRERSGDSSATSPRTLSTIDKVRFLREARALSRLRHPNICGIYDLIEQPEADVLVLEYIEGETLRDVLEGEISVQQKLEIAHTVAQVLATTHGEQIIHRDLKPDNIMLARNGQVKVLDFGLSRSGDKEAPLVDAQALARTPMHEEDGTGEDPGGDEPVDNRTEAGTTVGTFRYMSPEQATGEPVTTASDLFSFGIILFEMFTGRSPYPEGLSRVELLLRVSEARTAAVQEVGADVDADVAGLIQALLALDPDRRPSAADAAARLGAIIEKPRRRALRRRLVLTAAAVVTALCVAVGVTLRLTSEPVLRQADQGAAVALLPFADLTGDSSLGWVEWGLRSLVAEGLRGDPSLVILPADEIRQTVVNIGATGASPLEPEQLAELRSSLGARFIIRTQVLRRDELLVLRYTVYDQFGPRTTQEVKGVALGEGARLMVHRLSRLLSLPIADDVRVSRWSRHDMVNQLYAMSLQHMVTTGPATARDFLEVCVALDPDFPWARLQLAGAHIMLGEMQTARSFLGPVLELDDPQLRMVALRNLAQIERNDGSWDEALAHLREALALAQEHGGASEQAETLGTLGTQLLLAGDLEQAEAMMMKARQIHLDEGNVLSASYVTLNLGYLADEAGEIERASEYYLEAQQVGEDLHDRGLVGTCHLNLGVLAWNQEDLETAEAHYLEALQISEELGLREDVATIYNNLAGLAMMREDDAKTRRFFDQAMELYQEMGNALGLARTSWNIAEYLTELGEYHNAEPYARTALDWYNDDALVWLLAAKIEAGLGRPQKAIEALERSRSLDPEGWSEDYEGLMAECRKRLGMGAS